MNDEHAADTVDAMVGDLPLVAAAAEVSDDAPDSVESALAESQPAEAITPEMLHELATGHGDDPERIAQLDRLLDDPALSEAYYDLLLQDLGRAPLPGATPDEQVSLTGHPALPVAEESAPTAVPPTPTTSSVTPGGTLVVPITSRRGQRWALVAMMAALVVVALPLLRKRPPAPIDPMSGAGTAPVTLIGPEADAALTPEIRFVWHRLRGALSYEMVLFDRKGQPLQRQATADTVLSASNAPPETAAWSITTMMADGTRRTSEVRKFSASR